MLQTPQITQRVLRITDSATMRVAAAAEALRRAGEDIVDFGAGEPDFATPDHVKEAGIAAIQANFTKYTSPAGTLELREAICARHAADYGTHYTPAECIATVGGKHAIFNATQVLVSDGDDVVVPVPYWVTYKDVVEYAGGRCVFVETNPSEGFTLTAAMVERAMTPKTRAVIVNSPNNPSGSVISIENFEKIVKLAAAHGAFVITDECYCRLQYEGVPFSVASLPGAKTNVVVAGSLSKTYAMTGWRIGYALAPEPVASAIVKVQSQSVSHPSSVSQKAAVAALLGPQDEVATMLAEYRRRRDFVIPRLRRIPGVKCGTPQGAFYAYPDVSSLLGGEGIGNTLEFTERLLREQKVAVVPSEAFGGSGHIRISYATSMHELERGLDRIQSFVSDLNR